MELFRASLIQANTILLCNASMAKNKNHNLFFVLWERLDGVILSFPD